MIPGTAVFTGILHTGLLRSTMIHGITVITTSPTVPATTTVLITATVTAYTTAEVATTMTAAEEGTTMSFMAAEAVRP